MAYQISEDCIICNKCINVCPVGAISMGEDVYEIDERTCIECKGFFRESQCVNICPIDDIITRKKF